MSGSSPNIVARIYAEGYSELDQIALRPGESLRLCCAFTSQSTGAPTPATGVFFTIQQPDGLQTVVPTEELTSASSGSVWKYDFLINQAGLWLLTVENQDATIGLNEASFFCAPSEMREGDRGPAWVTAEGDILVAPEGQFLTIKRMDRLPLLGLPAPGDRLPIVRGGVGHTVSWTDLETRVQNVAEEASQEAGAVAGAAAGTTAGATSGAAAGAAAGTTAGAASGAAAGAEVALPVTLANAPAAPWVQSAGDGAVALETRTINTKLRESVSFLDFKTPGRTDGQAIAAAADYLWRNNGDAGGRVVIPPGPPLTVTEGIDMRPGVTVDGQGRRIVVPSWTTSGKAVFQVDGTNHCTIKNFFFGDMGKRTGPVRIQGMAEGTTVSGLRTFNGRTVWLERARTVRLIDLICYGGTGLVGGGSNSSSLIEDVVAMGLEAYDTDAEAIDLNFNIKGFALTGAVFRRCSDLEVQEIVDIGGGDCRDITLTGVVIDCGVLPVTAIRIKQNTANTKIIGCDIRAGVVGNIGIHASGALGLQIIGTNVDKNFARGFFSEPSTRDVSWIGGSCNSPIVVNGSKDLSFNVTHDGENTTAASPAMSVNFGAERVTFSGAVRNRPAGNAVEINGGAPTIDCGVEFLRIQNTLRGVAINPSATRPFVRKVRANNVARNVVILSTGCENAQVREIEAVDCSTESPGVSDVVSVSAGCHGSQFIGIRSVDTRTTGQTAARPLAFTGANHGVEYSQIVGSNIVPVTPVNGTGNLSNSYAGTAYIVTAPQVDLDLISANSLHSTVTVGRATPALWPGDSGLWSVVPSGVPRFDPSTGSLYSEDAATELALDRRNLAAPSWVKSGITASQDALGVDGVAAAASRLVATSNGGTVLQSFTAAATTRPFAAFVRRVAGTGAVEMTQNGSTWTAVSLTTSWQRLSLVTSQLNPQFGFRMATAGDEIEVDYVSLVAEINDTTPVPDGQASRAAEAIRWLVPASWPTARTVYIDLVLPRLRANDGLVIWGASEGANDRLRCYIAANALDINCEVRIAGTNVATLNLGPAVVGSNKLAFAVDAASVGVLRLGGAVQSHNAAPSSLSSFWISGAFARRATLNVPRMRGLVSRVSNAALPGGLAAW